jgi:hypothetical protein
MGRGRARHAARTADRARAALSAQRDSRLAPSLAIASSSIVEVDHIGNFDAFPNAELSVQLDEYVGWLQAVSFAKDRDDKEDQSWVFSSFDPDDLVKASRGAADGRIVFLRGDVEVLPGITAHLAKGSHTFGTQWFEVRTRNGPYCIVGDTIYWYANTRTIGSAAC